jgi:dCMP deaminase
MEDKEIRRHITYLKMASEWSSNSCCKRKKVGALIVKNNMIISDGYNGTPSGFPNDCEGPDGSTQWYVLHAEANAITKLAKSTQDSEGSTLYLTLSPCRDCSKLIIQSGIKKVIYKEEYRDLDGLKILKEAGVSLLKLDYARI